MLYRVSATKENTSHLEDGLGLESDAEVHRVGCSKQRSQIADENLNNVNLSPT